MIEKKKQCIEQKNNAQKNQLFIKSQKQLGEFFWKKMRRKKKRLLEKSKNFYALFFCSMVCF